MEWTYGRRITADFLELEQQDRYDGGVNTLLGDDHRHIVLKIINSNGRKERYVLGCYTVVSGHMYGNIKEQTRLYKSIKAMNNNIKGFSGRGNSLREADLIYF